MAAAENFLLTVTTSLISDSLQVLNCWLIYQNIAHLEVQALKWH